MDEARSHPSVDWLEYFKSIQHECPWSLGAYLRGQIDIQSWSDTDILEPLGQYQARMYVVDYPDSIVEAMAQELDLLDLDCEWLFSYPGYGEFATPVKVLIQQHRQQLNHLRQQLERTGSENP